MEELIFNLADSHLFFNDLEECDQVREITDFNIVHQEVSFAFFLDFSQNWKVWDSLALPAWQFLGHIILFLFLGTL